MSDKIEELVEKLPIDVLCEQEPEPQEPLELELWCLIVGMVGTAFPVIVKGCDRVWELQKTIKNEAVEIFGDFNAAQLRVYLAKKDNGEWLSAADVKNIENGDIEPAKILLERGHLAPMSQLWGIFKDRDANAVHVLIPAPLKTSELQVEADITGKRKRSEQSVGNLETIGDSVEELRLLFDVLGQKKQTEQKMVATCALNAFCKEYGGFPSSYFVRKEEIVLWGLVMRLLSTREKRVVVVGSMGVGKSCFLMLVSFYLALVEKRKVLTVRRLKNFSGSSAVIYLDGGSNTCIRKANLTAAKIVALPDRKEFQDALIFVDGYSRKEVDQQFGLFPYQLLATSMEDEYNSHELTSEVVLPAWRFNDLLHYAESTLDDWKKATGLGREDCQGTFDLVNEQYCYSGGSLRDFCKNREDVKNEIDSICGKAQAVDREHYQGGPRKSGALDRIRRHYVLDPNDEENYWQVCHWKIEIDAGYAFRRIGWFMNEDNQLSIYRFAQKLREGFWASAYKQCFHGAIRRSTKRSPVRIVNVVVNSDPSCSNQRYDRLELHGRPVGCEGSTEEQCHEHLPKVSSGAYWHPDSVNFPFIDAVVLFEAVLRGTNMKEMIVAVISTTVSDVKAFRPGLWKKLTKALDANGNIARSIPRVFVVVGPDANTCKRLTLIDAPPPEDFMVCCYDPLKIVRKRPNARLA